MNCHECVQLIVPLIRGHLKSPLDDEVRAHISRCAACSEEYADTDWLIRGMEKNSAEIRSSHISPVLLYEYRTIRGFIPRDVIEVIETHLAACDDCSADLHRITQLLSVPIEPEKPARFEGTKVGIWKRAFSFRLVPLYATAVIAIVIAAAVFRDFRREPTLPATARVVSEKSARESGYEVYPLAPIGLERGEDESLVDGTTTVYRADSDFGLLTLEVAAFTDEETSYRAVIKKASGEIAWETSIESSLLDAGALWVVIDKRTLENGEYRLSILEYSSGGRPSPIAESRFLLVD